MFHKEAKEILRMMEEAKKRGKELEQREHSMIRMGYIQETTSPFIINIVRNALHQLPEFIGVAVPTSTRRQIHDLLSEAIDVGSTQYIRELD